MRKTLGSREQKRLTALLRQVREERGLSQVAVAKALARHQSFVSKYEAGERRLDIVELRQVCEVLGVSLVDFVTRFEVALGMRHRSRP